MGRWEDEYGGTFGEGGGFPKKSRNWIRIGKFVILGGFIIVAAVILLVFIPRAGLSIEIIERGEIVGSIIVKNMCIYYFYQNIIL